MKKRKRKRIQWLTQHSVVLALLHDSRAEEEGGGGRKGSCPPSHGAGENHIILPPPRNLERAPRKNFVENARNGITRNIHTACANRAS